MDNAFHVVLQLFQEWNSVRRIVQFRKKINNSDSKDVSTSQERVFVSGKTALSTDLILVSISVRYIILKTV